MKKFGLTVVVIFLMGCTIGNGHICGPQTPVAYCDKEAYEKLMHPKPYGAHWIKEGMTREMRLQDLESCGNSKSLNPGFTDAMIRAETLPNDVVSPRSYNKDLIDNPQAEARLGKKRMLCMQSKGYSWLEQCDARCLHP
jgi:hypothetical protein